MAEDLAEHFILYGHVGLASDMIPELRLDHAEGALDIRSLMVVQQELLAVEGEVVEHLFPEASGGSTVDALKGNIGCGAMVGNHIHIVDATIALIG